MKANTHIYSSLLVLLKSALDALEAVGQHPADERVVPILLPGRAQHRNAVDVRPHFDVQRDSFAIRKSTSTAMFSASPL